MPSVTHNVQPEMTFKRLPDGAREITHPSGLVVVETLRQRAELRACLAGRAAVATKQLADFDAQEKADGFAVEEKLNGE